MSTSVRSGLVDFHCHLDLYPDLTEEVERCEKEGIFTLAVTTTPRAWPRNNELTGTTRHVRAALGLHPQLVANHAHEIELWEELLPFTRYVGEVGLDAGPRFYKSFSQQKEVFSHILSACAAARNKVITVHSTRSTKVVLDLIEMHMPPEHGRIVLHWFTGTAAEARRAIDLGCYFSINTEMMKNNKRMAVVQLLPLNRLLTETDGPFTEVDHRPSRPSDVAIAADGLASMFGIGSSEMRLIIKKNLKSVLEISS